MEIGKPPEGGWQGRKKRIEEISIPNLNKSKEKKQ
jgi:hypothetical protein